MVLRHAGHTSADRGDSHLRFSGALLSDAGDDYSFAITHAVRGLVGLVLVFNVYLVYQQLQINRIRRQVTEQAFSVDKVELLAEEIYKVAVIDSLTSLHNRRYALGSGSRMR